MDDFTGAAAALELLADVAAQRENGLNQYSNQPRCSQSEDENDSDSPILDSFYESGGGAAILQMTNVSVSEFQFIYGKFQSHIGSNYNVGRGKKSRYKAKDVFFMCLTVCKYGGLWDFLGRLFDIKGPTFERLIIKFLQLISPFAYETYVEGVVELYTMTKLIDQKKVFATFKMARYATDVTFQQSNRPSGNMEEGKRYYSGKHKLYGYKTEVSVLPSGLAIGSTDHYPGSVSDVDIFYKNVEFHKKNLKKSVPERAVIDVGLQVEKYPRYWAVLIDKGYQGTKEVLAIHPRKKPKNGRLTIEDLEYNKKVSSDRIIVENYFGRQGTLWAVMANKYRWAERHYDYIFTFTLAMTNAHILSHPLRAEDNDSYQRLKNRHREIGVVTAQKRKKHRIGIGGSDACVWIRIFDLRGLSLGVVRCLTLKTIVSRRRPSSFATTESLLSVLVLGEDWESAL